MVLALTLTGATVPVAPVAQGTLLRRNPLALGEVERAPPGKTFEIIATIPREDDTGAVLRFDVVCLSATEGGVRREVRADAVVTHEETTSVGRVHTIAVTVPEYDVLFGDSSQLTRFVTRAMDVRVDLRNPDGTVRETNTFAFEVPLRRAGTAYGIAALLGALLFLRLVKPVPFLTDTRFGQDDTRLAQWNAKPPWARLLAFPLSFAITPISTYSVSVAQIVFWTAVVTFASAYVFVVRGEFLDVTPQMLGLLGISAGTALVSKANATLRTREIPAELFEGLRRNRLPRLADLITSGGLPNIFKFQMLVFTVINGVLVLRQVYREFNFPEIPEGQLALMGISSVTYLGGEFTATNVWDTLKRKAEAWRGEHDPVEKARIRAEVQRLLKRVYEAT